MKIVLIGSALLVGVAVADGLAPRAHPPGASPLCADDARGVELQGEPQQDRHFFMREVEAEANVDYSILSVAPRDDRHYFMQSPPIERMPDLRERLCNLDWLEEFIPDGPLEWFDFER